MFPYLSVIAISKIHFQPDVFGIKISHISFLYSRCEGSKCIHGGAGSQERNGLKALITAPVHYRDRNGKKDAPTPPKKLCQLCARGLFI